MFGVTFINGGYTVAIKLLQEGNLMHIPSGPGLATINKDDRYKRAIQSGDFAIPDSGYFVLLLRILKNVKIKKYSGQRFLKDFFASEKFNKGDLFLVDPNKSESKINNEYLNKIGIPISNDYHFVAPIYDKGEIKDKILLDKLESLKIKPKFIMINLGSNVQEPLGCYIKNNLSYKVGIFGSGAAISFFTGTQAPISSTIDSLGLGWLWRCISNPKKFIPRYFAAFYLILVVIKEDYISSYK